MSDCKKLNSCRIDWFENVNDLSDDFSLAVKKTIGDMKSIGVKIFAHPYHSPKSWELSGRTHAPDLMEKTTNFYRSEE